MQHGTRTLHRATLLVGLLCAFFLMGEGRVFAGPAQPDSVTSAEKKRKKPKKKRKSAKADKSGLGARDFYLYEHHIRRGETVLKIARKYGVSVEKVLTWNDMTSPHLIKAGETLTIYSKKRLRRTEKAHYTVKKGDTLGGIARRHKMSIRELKSMNRLRRDLIHPGDRLVVLRPKAPEVAHMGGGRKSAYLDESVQLASARGFYVKRPKHTWGKPHTVRQIQRAFKKHRKRYRKSEIAVGDISSKHGGPLSGHRSHQRGIDVDIGFYRKGVAKDRRFHKVTPRTLDARRTWHLLHAFLEQGQVEMMFIDHVLQKRLYEEARRRGMSKKALKKTFQYPRGRGARIGIIRHEPGHADHVHIRFRDVPQRRTSRGGSRRAGASK